MGLQATHLVAQWAGATSFVAVYACIVAAALGVELSCRPPAPAADAFRLARLMALLGGASVLVAGAASTLYWWRVGRASGTASAAAGAGLVAAAALFALAVRALHARVRRDIP
jgi:hypothetical protein